MSILRAAAIALASSLAPVAAAQENAAEPDRDRVVVEGKRSINKVPAVKRPSGEVRRDYALLILKELMRDDACATGISRTEACALVLFIPNRREIGRPAENETTEGTRIFQVQRVEVNATDPFASQVFVVDRGEVESVRLMQFVWCEHRCNGKQFSALVTHVRGRAQNERMVAESRPTAANPSYFRIDYTQKRTLDSDLFVERWMHISD